MRGVRHLQQLDRYVQICMRFAASAALVFATICLWFAIDGFTSIADSTDPEPTSGGRSFAWFWTFLAGVGLAIAWLSWKFARTQIEDKDA
jgi:hypothetical protein